MGDDVSADDTPEAMFGFTERLSADYADGRRWRRVTPTISLLPGTLFATLEAMTNDEVSSNEIERINELADELNDEARDVLEYQVIS
jgi:hypothetical protein